MLSNQARPETAAGHAAKTKHSSCFSSVSRPTVSYQPITTLKYVVTWKAGRFEDCMEACERAKEWAPHNLCAPLFSKLAYLQSQALMGRQAFADAQNLLKDAVEAHPSSSEGWILLAEVYLPCSRSPKMYCASYFALSIARPSLPRENPGHRRRHRLTSLSFFGRRIYFLCGGKCKYVTGSGSNGSLP